MRHISDRVDSLTKSLTGFKLPVGQKRIMNCILRSQNRHFSGFNFRTVTLLIYMANTSKPIVCRRSFNAKCLDSYDLKYLANVEIFFSNYWSKTNSVPMLVCLC